MNRQPMIGLVIMLALILTFAACTTASKVGDDKMPDRGNAKTPLRSAYPSSRMDSMTNTIVVKPRIVNRGNITNRTSRFFDSAAYAVIVKERAASERSNLFVKVSLTPVQQKAFDDLVSTMNSSLKQRSEKITAMMQAGKQSSPEKGYHMLREYASTLLQSYEMMDRAMPVGWREKVGDNFDMRNFMDPAIREASRGVSHSSTSVGVPSNPSPQR